MTISPAAAITATGTAAMYLGVTDIIVLFCAGLTALMILSQVVTSERRPHNLLFIAVLLCILALQVQFVLAGTRLPVLFAVHDTLWYLLGPLTYIHYRNVIFQGRSSRRRAVVLLVPAALVMAAEIAGLLGAGPLHPSPVRLAGGDGWGLPRLLTIGGLASLLGFFLEFFVFVFRTWSPRVMPPVVRYVTVTYIVPVASVSLILAAHLAGSPALERWGYCLFALQMIAWYLMGHRLPEVFLLLRREYRKRYARSLIANLETGLVLERLKGLMERERLYLDDGLTINALAGRLEITAHQLSELLNARLGMGFKRYLNGLRVGEAKRLLDSDPGLTALAAGLAVGFNSKSAFYSAFREIAGMSPLAYRRRRGVAGSEKKSPGI
ncbi:MAG: AraC family transcriptional regulator [Spirochaetes bacterium]|nr:AraC family transcriptional regulator [Spirochaetota bacterium]